MKCEQFEIKIHVDQVELGATLTVPERSSAMVIFSHGSGSSRFSPRNNFVAKVLNEQGIATLLNDLLTQQEDEAYGTRFDIELLTKRLIAVTNFILRDPDFENFSLGYFGASTGAASALCAAAQLNDVIDAVVSRGGRPDLAELALSKVKAPTLLIVGGFDEPVIDLNQEAFESLHCEKEMKIVSGATHLSEEPGKLEEVAQLASEWFEENLVHHEKKILAH